MKIIPQPGPLNQMSQLGGLCWNVPKLFTLSKDLPVMEIPLDHLNISDRYNGVTLKGMVSHMQAVNDADLSFPIILSDEGEIMDGRHRVMKAILTGAKTIKAVRFEENPMPCQDNSED